jgi:dTDP-4-amino-4,6-dideoxygalactose transaminase
LLDNVQAAVLDRKLQHLPDWITHRQNIARHYRDGLAGVGDLRLPHDDDRRYADVFQNYVVRTRRRDELRGFLRDNGVETLVHWPKPVWRHEALRLGHHQLDSTEAICREVVSLPMSAETTPEQVAIVVDVVRRFFA